VKPLARAGAVSISKASILGRSMIACVLAFGTAACAMAGTGTLCSSEMASRADTFLARSNVSWEELSQHQRTAGECDDGYFAEAYSELVVRLLAYRWDDFPAFAAAAKARPAFYEWVIKHIDETASPDDLAKVVSNAKSCPADPS
jgi:hypothetical protein